VRLLLDEMLPAVIAEQLRAHGHDVTAVAEQPGLRGTADPDLLEHALQGRRAIVTYNRDDFLALDRQLRREGRDHSGIVIVNPTRFPQRAATVGRLVRSLGAFLDDPPSHPGFVHWLQ
jgi:predicted nuclease of predicted toxin-antitoxin system